jgi:hypothetical protein
MLPATTAKVEYLLCSVFSRRFSLESSRSNDTIRIGFDTVV